ncbi:MAG TPA: MarC family protein [Candidatus Korarchaeota archaeon]|nr:MarC family protein [Candidatus Korarchaeota archaeon]
MVSLMSKFDLDCPPWAGNKFEPSLAGATALTGAPGGDWMDPLELARLVGISSVQIFAILNPPSVIPTMLSLTEGMSLSERRAIVKTASVTIFALMAAFALVGREFLTFMGLSVSGLKLGGGVLLMVLSVDMLKGVPRTREVEKEELAVVPLATPLLVGPGTITTVLVLSATLPSEVGGRLEGTAVLLAAIALVVGATHFLLRHSLQLVRVLGVNGTRALGRFMAIIIAGVAAEMMHSAVVDWVGEILASG